MTNLPSNSTDNQSDQEVAAYKASLKRAGIIPIDIDALREHDKEKRKTLAAKNDEIDITDEGEGLLGLLGG